MLMVVVGVSSNVIFRNLDSHVRTDEGKIKRNVLVFAVYDCDEQRLFAVGFFHIDNVKRGISVFGG